MYSLNDQDGGVVLHWWIVKKVFVVVVEFQLALFTRKLLG